jgi:hypothetical protein
MARTLLETLKVEIAAAHLAQSHVPPVALTSRTEALPITRRQ